MRSVTSPPPAHSSTHPQHGKPWKVTLKTSPPPSVTIYLYACAKVLRPWLPATESSQSPRDLSRGPPPPGSAGHRHSEASSSGHQTPQNPAVWHPSGPRCKGPGEDRDLLGNLDFQKNMGKTAKRVRIPAGRPACHQLCLASGPCGPAETFLTVIPLHASLARTPEGGPESAALRSANALCYGRDPTKGAPNGLRPSWTSPPPASAAPFWSCSATLHSGGAGRPSYSPDRVRLGRISISVVASLRHSQGSSFVPSSPAQARSSRTGGPPAAELGLG